MLWYYICILASATSTLLSSHRSLVFWGSTAQRANGEFIVQPLVLHLQLVPLLGFVTLRAHYADMKWGHLASFLVHHLTVEHILLLLKFPSLG